MVDADGGGYAFEEGDIPPEGHVDDLWRFDEFTDFIYQEAVTGRRPGCTRSRPKGYGSYSNCAARMTFCRCFRRMLIGWSGGTRAAFGYFIELYVRESICQYALGYYPADESCDHTAIFPARRTLARAWRRRQAEFAATDRGHPRGATFPWPQPFYLRQGEDRYVRHLETPPKLEGALRR